MALWRGVDPVGTLRFACLCPINGVDMRSFFAKVGKSDVPKKLIAPETAAEWEGGDLVAPIPRRLLKNPKGGQKTEPAQNPELGDQVFVYVHLNDHGFGLTGVATISKVRQEDSSTLKIQMTAVTLFQSPYLQFVGGKDARKFEREGNTIEATGLLREFHCYRPNRMVEMSEADVQEVLDILHRLGDFSVAVSEKSGRVTTRPELPDGADAGKGSVISTRTRHLLDKDLEGALEGMTEQRKAAVRTRAASLAESFFQKRIEQRTLQCDECQFNPEKRTSGTAVDPRSLLDVHHKNPLAEGIRVTTLADFSLLCPTCHRFAHALLRADLPRNDP